MRTLEARADRRVAADPPSPPSLAPRGRRINRTEVAIGLLVAFGCALGAVFLHLSSVERTPVLTARGGIDQGQEIRAEDLAVVNVAADGELAYIGRDRIDEVIGRRATTSIAAGQLLAEGMTTTEGAIGEDQALVGLALIPGQLPTLDLSPGDRVHVVVSSAPAEGPVTAGEDEDPEGEVRDDPVLTRSATIVSVETLDADRRLVTLATSEADAEAVAAAAGGDSLRIVAVAS